MSLQVPLPLSHANQVREWSSFEVYTWIAKHNDKFSLSQDDLDSIEESPITGKQLMSKDDEQLSQEWAISIHAARKIVKKAQQIQKKAKKRRSEPIINALNNGSLNNYQNNIDMNNNNNNHKKTTFETKTNDKASINPSLNNIREDVTYTTETPPRNRMSPALMASFTPKYGPSSFCMDNQDQQYKEYQQSLLQTKLTLTIKNDTFMARLSHPKWWMDGHFNYIPNKIGCKDSISIEITGDLDTPLVGLMAFTLTLDPRYATAHHSNGNGYAFSPYVGNVPTSNIISPHIPSWMIGPGGLPYIPPSVAKLYELQQQYITKVNEMQNEKEHKKHEIELKKKQKEERLRIKQQARQQRLKIKREKKKIKKEQKRIKKEQEQKKETETENTDTNKENTDMNTDKTDSKDENDENDGNDSVIEKDTESETESSSEEESESESETMSVVSDELDIDEPPKYRLIILWSITPTKTDSRGNVRNDRRDDIARNSMAMMSVASSDLLNQMNRFNVLLLEDDTDPDGPDEFNLDNSYFNELEQAALIADIEQCLVDNEHFEIAATFGTSLLNNNYTLQIDIDDSLGDWPGPLQQFNSNNPFALGFIPTNMPMQPYMNPYMNPYAMHAQQNMAMGGYTPTPHAQPPLHNGYPDITMIHPQHRGALATTSATTLPPKSGHRSGHRSRSNSQPAPPVGMLDNNSHLTHRDSKMFTLTDILSESRHVKPHIALPQLNSTNRLNNLNSPISPLTVSHFGAAYNAPNTGKMQWRPRGGRKNSHSKAQRLSLWKEQINTLHHNAQQQQQNYHAKNLYVPDAQKHTQNKSPSLSALSRQHVSHASPESHSHTLPVIVQYNIGDCVFVDDSKLGQIKSIGQHPAWGKGTYYGIRLTEKIGNCDGEWKGQRTFSCPSGYGYFVQRNQLTQKLKTTRFDFMAEDYVEDKKKEFEKLKAEKEAKKQSTVQDEFAAAIFNQKQQQPSDDEDPGESDIPKPGTNVAQIMGQSSSERILSKTKPTGKYVPKFENKSPVKKESAKKPKTSNKSEQPSHRRQRSDSKPLNAPPVKANPNWTGGAPRTVVVRSKIPQIKEHAGYLNCVEGIKYQKQMEWKKAIEKFKLGIALLEVSLTSIDRSMTKRKWKAQIEEFRHKMSRCTFEIQNNKRNRFIKKRDKIAKEQAIKREEAAVQIQAQKMKDAKAQVVKREDHWKVTREDMDKKIAEHEIDQNYDPSTGMRPDEDDEVNSGRVGGDKTLAKAKKEHKKKKKKKGKKGRDKYDSGGSGSDDDDDDDDKKKDTKISKHDKELRSRIEGDVMTADPDVSFADVVGLNNVKLALYETIILPYIRPDLFESVKKSTQGLLLFGPPGNGKTMIAKCVASECDATFFSISASSITSKFVGEAERIMRTLFTMARQRAPSIIFIDEIDSLLRARGGANEAESSRKIKTEFLIQFDGVKSAEDKDKTITVIGATNLPDQLDNAVLRRFPKRIQVPNPDAGARYSLIRLLMSKHRHNLSEQCFRQLGKKTDNYSCSDIAMLCNDAAMGPLRSMTGAVLLTAKKSDIPKIALVHFQASLLNIRASCDPATIKFYKTWDEQFGSKLFLTMDVLPDNMKQKPLLSVEDEKKQKIDAEQEEKRAVDEEQQKKEKQEQLKLEQQRLEKQEKQKEKQEKQKEKQEKEKEKQKEKQKQSKLLKINAPADKKNRRKSENLFKSKRKSNKQKSDDLKRSKYPGLSDSKSQNVTGKKDKNGRNSGSSSFNKPKVLNPKTIKISSSFSPPPTKTKIKNHQSHEASSSNTGSRHKARSSSQNIDVSGESFADKKKLWTKRSSRSGTDKKKKVKK